MLPVHMLYQRLTLILFVLIIRSVFTLDSSVRVPVATILKVWHTYNYNSAVKKTHM